MECEGEIRSVSNLEEKLANLPFPFEEVAPTEVHDWLQVFASSRGTTRELFLLTALTSTSALIGKTTIEVFNSYEEKGNLCLVAVAPSGAGKSPACHHGCIDPIVQHLEPKIEKSIVLDETSVNGLFNHFVSSEHRQSVFFFVQDYIFIKVDRPSELDNGEAVQVLRWRLLVCVQGEQGEANRCFVSKGLIDRFYNPEAVLRESLAKNRGGRKWASRAYAVFFFYQKRVHRDLEQMAQVSQQLEDNSVKSVKVVLENIHTEHNNAELVKYHLNHQCQGSVL